MKILLRLRVEWDIVGIAVMVFSSAWHAFRKTAENNARGYEKIHRGVTCSVMYD